MPGASVFAGLYVAAQAIERAIEPLSNRAGGILDGFEKVMPGMGSKRAKKEFTVKHRREMRNEAAAKELGSLSHAQSDKAAVEAGDAVAFFRSNATVFMWGIASLHGCVLSGWPGLLLLRTVGVTSPAILDVAVTGLSIEAGTKPLHDRIGNLATSKRSKQDARQI